MKSLIAFWKQDMINKLIVIVASALILGGAAVVFLIVNMPKDRTLKDAFVDFLPHTATPTFDVNAYLPTSTPVQLVETSVPFPLPSLTQPVPTVTLEIPSPTPPFTPTLEPTGTPDRNPVMQSACIPNNSAEVGRVVEIVDGNTIKVLMNEKVYVVRYIGIKVPRDGEIKEPFGPAATFANSQLVYGKEIVLIPDVSDKDDRGRLLRYVMVGETFVNLEMLRQGYGLAEDIPPDTSCAGGFANAEQEARQSLVGQWLVVPTP